MILILKIVLFIVITVVFAAGAVAFSIFRTIDKSIHSGLDKDKKFARNRMVLVTLIMLILLFWPSLSLWQWGIAAFAVFGVTVVQVRLLHRHGEIPALSTNTEGGEPC